jgi:hypothetical protein
VLWEKPVYKLYYYVEQMLQVDEHATFVTDKKQKKHTPF